MHTTLGLCDQPELRGENNIPDFTVNRGPHVVPGVLTTVWEMQNTQQKLERSQKTRVQILGETAQGKCVDGCNGQWLACAGEVLQQNGI